VKYVTGRYVYGIIETAKMESFGNIGVGNSEVYTLQHGGIGAVVSDIPANYKFEVEEAVTHEKTLRKIMETNTIIPMGFGVIARTEIEIKNILKQGRMKFKNKLEKIDNRLQINVKISWDKNILAEILEENEEIRKLAAEAKKKTHTRDQSLKIELGRKVKSALDQRKSKYQKNIHSVLGNLSSGFRETKITDQDTVMNASFLVEKEQEQKFYDKTSELEKEYDKKLTILVVGPLPPYNFTEIEIKKINSKTIENARKTLGLSQEISISEINSAYDRLAQKCHPDLHSDDSFAEEKFKKIKSAHEVLMQYCEHYVFSLEKSKIEETFVIREKTG
jgi:ribosomal protein L14E/L6E/L27E